MKKAFLTGITGQDGSYLAELLLGDALVDVVFSTQVLTDIVMKGQLKPDCVFVSHPPLVHHDYILGSQRRVGPISKDNGSLLVL